jgi:hypothetical protein
MITDVTCFQIDLVTVQQAELQSRLIDFSETDFVGPLNRTQTLILTRNSYAQRLQRCGQNNKSKNTSCPSPLLGLLAALENAGLIAQVLDISGQRTIIMLH